MNEDPVYQNWAAATACLEVHLQQLVPIVKKKKDLIPVHLILLSKMLDKEERIKYKSMQKEGNKKDQSGN